MSSQDDALREKVLHIVATPFKMNKVNIWLLYGVDHLYLHRFVQEMCHWPPHLQEQFVEILVFISTDNDFVLFKELVR